MNGPPTAASTSPAVPLPPMPSTTTLSISSAGGSPPMPVEALAASATCSGKRAARPNMSWLSSTSLAPVTSTIEGRGDALRLGLGQEAVVLGVVDGLGLVDQHDRDVLADGVAALEPRVVERVLVLEVEQRALVLRAGEDLEELGVECHDVNLCLVADQCADLGHVLVARRPGRRLQVEPQQRLGVGGAEVEPPVAVVDREAVDPVLGGVGIGGRDPLDDGGGVVDRGVDLAGRRVAVER